MKRLLGGYLVFFLILIIVLPPVGAFLFGVFFIPALIVFGFAEAYRLLRSAFTQ